jgi:hypothetical protein
MAAGAWQRRWASANPSVYGTMSLTATASGKRQAIGDAQSVRLSAASAGTIYYLWSNASGAIAVSSSNTALSVPANTDGSYAELVPPSGYRFLEYLRHTGDVTFTLSLVG